MYIARGTRKKKKDELAVVSKKPTQSTESHSKSITPFSLKAESPTGAFTKNQYKTTSSIEVAKAEFEQERKNSDAAKNEESKEVEIPTEFISAELAASIWAKYIEKVKESGRMSYWGTISHLMPKVKENGAILFEINNSVIEKEFIESKPEIITFYRNQTQKTLVIETIVNETIAPKKYMTDRDKFEKMAENNPALIQLRKALDLEFEH